VAVADAGQISAFGHKRLNKKQLGFGAAIAPISEWGIL